MAATEEELKKVNQQLEHITREMALIKYTLVGNSEFKSKGLVQKIEEHDQYITNDKSWKNRVWGAAVLLGLLWQPVYDTLKEFFHNSK